MDLTSIEFKPTLKKYVYWKLKLRAKNYYSKYKNKLDLQGEK